MRRRSDWAIPVVAVLMAGCARVPEDAVRASQASLEAARGQKDWAAEELAKAEAAHAAALQEVDAQKGRLFASYARSRQLLAAARDAAGQVQRAAAANRRAATDRAEKLASSLAAALTEARRRARYDDEASVSDPRLSAFERQIFTALGRAARGASWRDARLDEAARGLEKAREALGRGDVLPALEQLATVQKTLNRVYPDIAGG